MLTHDYSYDACLRGSVTKAWTVDDCFRGRDFDFDKPFLPERIAGVEPIGCLTGDEKRMLNQIRGNSYCHIFAFVEEYIVPLVMDRARADVYGDETRLWSLLRFAEEEVKHQEMLRRAVDAVPGRVRRGLRPGPRPRGGRQGGAGHLAAHRAPAHQHDRVVHPAPLRRARPRPGRARRAVPGHPPLPLDRRVPARPHGQPPHRRGRRRAHRRRSGSRRSTSCSNWAAPSTGCSAQQIELDIDALQRATGRTFTDVEREEIRTHQRRAYRWTFIVSGLEHPNFVRIVEQLTPNGTDKIAAAAQALAA